jgi:hypothetical protein
MGGARSRPTHTTTTQATPPAPTIAAPVTPTALAPTPAAPTVPEVSAATPTTTRAFAVPSAASGGGQAAATAASSAPTGGPSSDPRLTAAPTPTADQARRANPVETNVPSSDVSGARPTWTEPRHLLQLRYFADWRPADDQTQPNKILDGPDGTSLFLEIRPLAGPVDTEVTLIVSELSTDPEVRSVVIFQSADSIGNEYARSFLYRYLPKDQPQSGVQVGQIWIVNHGSNAFIFRAKPIGLNNPELQAIIDSVSFP